MARPILTIHNKSSSDAAAAADVDGLVVYDDMRVKLSSHSPRVPFYIDDEMDFKTIVLKSSSEASNFIFVNDSFIK